MTRERYINMCIQMDKEINEDEIPVSFEDLPEFIQISIHIFNSLGDRVYPEIGYVGKDYTNLPIFIETYEIDDKEFLLEVLNTLDSRAIKKSAEHMKREMDKLKRKK